MRMQLPCWRDLEGTELFRVVQAQVVSDSTCGEHQKEKPSWDRGIPWRAFYLSTRRVVKRGVWEGGGGWLGGAMC
jgi:hypothetical protein